MDILVRDNNLNGVGVIDIYESLIWRDRFSRFGDFELLTKASTSYVQLLRQDYFLSIKDSDHTMIIESINLKTDEVDGATFMVKGRSLETILERRIVWSHTLMSGGLQSAVEQLLNDNAINPSDPDRKISNLDFVSSDDPAVIALSVNEQFHGETLYQVINALCDSKGIGFKVTLALDGRFKFQLIAGKDRSYNQIENPFVAFTPELDNLSRTNYYHSKTSYKTVSLVGGEGEGSDRITAAIALPGGAGTELDRREMFTDARDVSQTSSGGVIPPEQYQSYLMDRGFYDLVSNIPTSFFDGTVEPGVTYHYDVDYFLGDIVQMENEFGLKGVAKVTEVIFSVDLGGFTTNPTFEMIN